MKLRPYRPLLFVCVLGQAACGGRTDFSAGANEGPTSPNGPTDPQGPSADPPEPVHCSALVVGEQTVVRGIDFSAGFDPHLSVTSADRRGATVVFQQSGGLVQIAFPDWRQGLTTTEYRVLANQTSPEVMVSLGPAPEFAVAGRFGSLRYEHAVGPDDSYVDFPLLAGNNEARAAFISEPSHSGARFIGLESISADGGRVVALRYGKQAVGEGDDAPVYGCGECSAGAGLWHQGRLLSVVTSAAGWAECGSPSTLPNVRAFVFAHTGDEVVLLDEKLHTQQSCGPQGNALRLIARSDGGAWLLGLGDDARRIDKDGRIVEARYGSPTSVANTVRFGDGFASARFIGDLFQVRVFNESGELVETIDFPRPAGAENEVALLEDRAGKSLLVVRTGPELAGQGAFDVMRIDCIP